MFTLDEINTEVDNYIKNTQKTIPYIQKVIYGTTYPSGLVRFSDLEKQEYKLYLNSDNDKHPIKYRKSILWHEFTHIYDFINCKDISERKYFMASVSEINASEIQHRYLTDIGMSDYITIRTPIYFEGQTIQYMRNLFFHFEMIKSGIAKYEETKLPKHFEVTLNYAMYACGAVKLLKGGNLYFLQSIKDIAEPYKTILTKIINDLYSNNGKHTPLLYCNLATRQKIGNMKAFIDKYATATKK